MLIVVPTTQQRSQYIDGLMCDLEKLEIPFRGIQRCDSQSGWVIKESHRNTSEIFVASVQSIASDLGYFVDLMSKGRWLVVADEFHHYGSEKAWGQCIKDLPYNVILGMSATPFRSDNSLTIFGKPKFDVSVTIASAYGEKAIRKVAVRVSDYIVTYSTQDDPEPQNRKLSDFADEWGSTDSVCSNISDYEIKKGVRYYDKYVSRIMQDAISQWIEYEALYPGQNQILVFAMSCRHAESIAKTINDIAPASYGFPAPFADWIGVGEGLTGNRSDKENTEILSRFQDNKLPCLVQVNKAGEGFNNKRCSIGVMLDLVGNTPMKIQHFGRLLRVNSDAPDLVAVIFTSEDHPAMSLFDDIEATFDEVDNRSDASDKPAAKTREYTPTIPDIFVIDTHFHSERIVYPYGSVEKYLEKFLEAQPDNVRNAYTQLPYDQALQIFTQGVNAALQKEHEIKHPQLTEEQKRKQVADQVNRNTGMLAGLVLTKLYGKSYPKSAKGDLFKKINIQWKRENCSHSDATIDDLSQKNKWLQSICSDINSTGVVPTWLHL